LYFSPELVKGQNIAQQSTEKKTKIPAYYNQKPDFHLFKKSKPDNLKP